MTLSRATADTLPRSFNTQSTVASLTPARRAISENRVPAFRRTYDILE
jgi:hypothetical protein